MTEPAPPFPVLTGKSLPLPTAVLRHTGGMQGDHFDVLLATRAPTGDDDLVCATWRTAHDPGGLAVGESTTADRIGAHRAAYLSLSGAQQLSADRGTVTPVRAGTWLARGLRGTEIELHWSDGARTVMTALPNGSWTRIDT